MSTLGAEKSQQARALLEADSLWLTLTREGSDPATNLLFDASVSGNAAFMLHPDAGVLAIVANYDEGHVERLGVFNDIQAYEKSFEDALKASLAKSSPKTIYINFSETDHLSDGLTHGQFLRLQKLCNEVLPNTTLASSAPHLAKVRGCKTPDEVRRLKVAINASNTLYEKLLPTLQVGQSEREIQAKMLEIAADMGFDMELGDYGGALVCINRVGLAHRAPGDDRVQGGDLVILDHGLYFEGYCSDLARTIYFRKPDEEDAPEAERHAFQSAFDAISNAFDAVKPGLEGWQVDEVARDHHLTNGYPEISHATGHQIGRHIHDGGAILGPRWERYGDAPYISLEVGNVFTLEPTILQSPYKPSMLVEENILITEKGAQWLSKRQTYLWTV
ncbi:MAG: M24 family metallopeptidase [Deinococcota bacterium]